MKRLASLVRVGLRSNFGLSLLRYKVFKKKQDLWLIPVIGLSLAGVAPLLYGYLLMLKGAYRTLSVMGQQAAILGFGVLMAQFLILVFGLYYVISAFYFSRDLETLIPLPVKPVEVMISKFTVILVNEYLTMSPVLLPLLISYGVLSHAGPGYWVASLVVYLLLPIIPLALVSVLTVGLMRVVNVGRKKDLLMIVGSLVLISLGLGLQLALGRTNGSGPNPQAVARFFTAPDSLLNQIGRRFPPSIWAAKSIAGGLAGSGLLNLALLAVVSVGLFGLIVVLAERLFYRGLIGLGEVSGRRRTLTSNEMSRRVTSGRRPVRAIFQREWRIMNRTPIFLLNGTLTAFLVPLMFVLVATTSRGRQGDIGHLLGMISAAADPYLIILVTASFLMVCGCLNGTSSSAFSREGSLFWISKVIPVSPRDQVRAKFMHSYLVALLGVVTALVVALFILKPKPAVAAAAVGLALIGGVGLTAVGMSIDLARPLLQWTNPQKAIKQNLNVVIAMLADMGFLSVIGYGLFRLAKAGLAGPGLLLIALGALTALSAASYHFLMRFAERRYREIEV
jgi:ABC-2 type transport system permease protein